MGTKKDPGPIDCYAHAADDEPIFVLRANDPTASIVVTFWRAMRIQLGKNDAKCDEAREVALAMEAWARAHGRDVESAMRAFERALRVGQKNVGA